MAENTLAALLESAAESTSGVRFLGQDEQPRFLEYSELLQRARRKASALEDRGVAERDRVAIVLPTGPEFYDAFFGAVLLGAVPVPLYPPVRLGRLAEYHEQTAAMIGGCRSAIVISDRRISRVLGRSVAAAGTRLGLVRTDELVGSEDHPARAVDPDSPALIQHSSGTTGRPRPVRLTHRAILSNVEAIRRRLLEAFPDREIEHSVVSWLPLYHDMGLIGCVITSMAHPVDLTLLPPELFVTHPGAWLRAVSRYRATISGAPDFAFAYCTDRIGDDELEGVDLSSWRVALNGAEPVTAGAMRRFAERFEPFGFDPRALTPVYGLAEATLAVTFSDPGRPFVTAEFDRTALVSRGRARRGGVADSESRDIELVAVGQPLEGVELRVAPLEGGDGTVPDGEVGRVLVGGPSLLDGYDNDPKDAPGSAGSDPAGWLDTGDTGFLFDGELFLYSRAKDVIVLRGLKYAPQDVEVAVIGLDGIRSGCVAAIGIAPTPGEQERLFLLAERARGGRSDRDAEVAEHARLRVLARTGLESSVVILAPGTLPRTSSGKIRRAEARERYVTGRLDPPGRAGVGQLTVEAVRSRLALARTRREASDDSRDAQG